MLVENGLLPLEQLLTVDHSSALYKRGAASVDFLRTVLGHGSHVHDRRTKPGEGV